MTKDLLIELGCEELPPKSLLTLGEAFERGILSGLKNANLKFGTTDSFWTPRRLAIVVRDLEVQQADRTVVAEGPPVSASFDKAGLPSAAALGFAKKCGVDITALDKSGPKLKHSHVVKGELTSKLVPELIKSALDQLPIPKRMRWASRRDEFVRPTQWLIVLFGSDVIPCEILGQSSAKLTRGHRFHSSGTHVIESAAMYESKLRTLHVIPRFSERKEMIQAQISKIESELGAVALVPPALLDEVSGLVEWPVPLVCSFEEKFLSVPQEALIATMQDNQKYFCLTDKNGKLIHRFITITNIDSLDSKEIISGNEKVVRPRLTDAEFFFKQDQKKPLESNNEKLSHIVFQAQLGTVLDRVGRIEKLAQFIGQSIGANTLWCQRAAHLSKCDLSTLMVNEFPEMQGIAGSYYAKIQGEPAEVATALSEQYMPKGAGLELPQTKTGIALALAEKVDTLVGIFGIGMQPTGSKDPYALRRAALGMLRILIEKKIHLNVNQVLELSVQLFDGKVKSAGLAQAVSDFIFDRLRARYEDEKVETVIYQSVRAISPVSPFDFDERVKAVQIFKTRPEALSLSSANKRVANILSKSGLQLETLQISKSLLTDPFEIKLEKELSLLESSIKGHLQERSYSKALSELSNLKETVDQFFEKVLVNADDVKVRENRIALLKKLRDQFLSVADISYLGA